MPIIVPAAKAVHISEYYGNRNQITWDRNLYISRFQGAGDIYRSLIGFDLKNLPGLFPPGTAVGSAYLQLLVTRNDILSGSINASLWRCREDWGETTVTWNSQPLTVETPDVTFTIPAGWTGMMTLEVTVLVQDWLSSVYSNYGFLLRGDEQNSRIVGFSPEASLVIIPTAEKPSTEKVIAETVFMDYPLRPESRYGYGKPSHPELKRLLNSNRSTYVKNMEYILGLRVQLGELPAVGEGHTSHPRWQNPWISGFDAISLCSFLVQNNPRRYVEIGSGESTRFARWTINRFGLRTRIISIDPSPRPEIGSMCDRIIKERAENADTGIFCELAPEDVLFIDSSHRVLMNSDVAAIFLDILPNLRPGVLVHFHNIFLPDDYPPDWIGRYYSEQYLLAAYLLAGSAMEVVQPNYFISCDHELSRVLEPIWTDMSYITRHGASFWIKMQ